MTLSTSEPSQTQNTDHSGTPRQRRPPLRYTDEDLIKAFDENDTEHFYYADDYDTDENDYDSDTDENEYDYDSDTLRDFVVSDGESEEEMKKEEIKKDESEESEEEIKKEK